MNDFFKTKLLILTGLLTVLLTIKGFQFDNINGIEIIIFDYNVSLELINNTLIAPLLISIFAYAFLFIKEGKYHFAQKIGDLFYVIALFIPVFFILLILILKLFLPIIIELRFEIIILILVLVILLTLIKVIISSSNYITTLLSSIANNQIDVSKLENIRSPNFAYTLLKRAIDILFSLFVIIYTLPLLIITSILIKISSKGPILITQNKVGIGGSHFKLIKFRILRHYDLESTHNQVIESSDPEMKLGKILSALFIDELPTFINVLKGDLSLIGPRSISPFIYESIVNNFSPVDLDRTGKSGLICLATFRAKRYFYSLDEYVKLDKYYLLNRSIKLDISIFLTAIRYIFINN